MERLIEVFVEFDGASQFVGRLWSRSLKGRESESQPKRSIGWQLRLT